MAEVTGRVSVENPIVSARRLAELVCNTLDVPFEGIASLIVSIKPKEPATVTIQRFIREQDAQGISTALESYVLVEPNNLSNEQEDSE
jgi:hypothetical protein